VTVASIIEPDVTSRYVLRRNSNPFFDDDVTITVDPATGFLQTVNATTTDQTVNAIGSLISAAASAMTFGAGLAPIPEYTIKEANTEYESITNNALFSSFQAIMDPNDSRNASGRCDVISGDGSFYARFTLSCTPPAIAPIADYQAPKEGLGLTNYDGIVTRRLIPYAVNVEAVVYSKDGAHRAKASFADQIVMLPDANRVYYVEVSRTPLVSNNTKITLSNGTIASQQRVRPSIVMGIVGVPQSLLKALAPIPLQIRTDQYNLISTQDKTLAAEADIKKLESAK
jgi:hypothetical protein